MWNIKNFKKLRASRYYSVSKFQDNYLESIDLLHFLISLENLELENIRFVHKKELLKVLEYVFQKYRLYSIESNYLSWFTFINKFVPFYISEREYIIIILILKLKDQIWGYHMYDYDFYYNVALNYIESCKRYILFHKILKDDTVRLTENIYPRLYDFPWESTLNKKYSIDKECYKAS